MVAQATGAVPVRRRGPGSGEVRRRRRGPDPSSFSIGGGEGVLKIYTRTGDDGTTGLLFGGRVAKDSDVMELNGTVDEAQAAMGLARAEAEPGSELDILLTGLERDLYVLMSEVATDPSNRSKLKPGSTLVTPADGRGARGPHRRARRPDRHAGRVRRPRCQPRLGRPRPGPHGGPPGRAPGRLVPAGRLAGRPPISTASPTCCGPWPGSPKERSTCWPGALPRRGGSAR